MILILFSFVIDDRLVKGTLFKADFIETLYSNDRRYIFKGNLFVWEKGYRIEVNEPFCQVLIGKTELEVYTKGIDLPSIYENKFPLNNILFNTEEYMASYEEKNGWIKIIPKDTMYVKEIYIHKGNNVLKIQLNLFSQSMIFVIKNMKLKNKFNENLLLLPPQWD